MEIHPMTLKRADKIKSRNTIFKNALRYFISILENRNFPTFLYSIASMTISSITLLYCYIRRKVDAIFGLFSRGVAAMDFYFNLFMEQCPPVRAFCKQNFERDLFIENFASRVCLQIGKKDLYNHLVQYYFDDIIQYYTIALIHERESRCNVWIVL
jgi:hypothetical protein